MYDYDVTMCPMFEKILYFYSLFLVFVVVYDFHYMYYLLLILVKYWKIITS